MDLFLSFLVVIIVTPDHGKLGDFGASRTRKHNCGCR